MRTLQPVTISLYCISTEPIEGNLVVIVPTHKYLHNMRYLTCTLTLKKYIKNI